MPWPALVAHVVFVLACSVLPLLQRGLEQVSFTDLGAWVWLTAGLPLASRRMWTAAVRAAEMAYRDPLTGVLNRAGLRRDFVGLSRRARRDGHALAVMIADVDDFKRINDMYGHSMGDAVIMDVAAHLDHRLGHLGVMARTGGEEFTVVAAAPAPVVERHVCSLTTVSPGTRCPAVTVSLGVTWCDGLLPECVGLERAMLVADRAMYRAKSMRGNRSFWLT